MHTKKAALWMVLLAAALVSAATFAAAPRTIEIKATEDLKFSLTHIDAKAGEPLKIVLIAVGTQDKDLMAHNFVLLDQGTDVSAFIMNSAIARANSFVAPSFKDKVLATTGLVAGGEKGEVTFNAPKKPGSYTFVCTFPGHYAGGMKGEFVVK